VNTLATSRSHRVPTTASRRLATLVRGFIVELGSLLIERAAAEVVREENVAAEAKAARAGRLRGPMATRSFRSRFGEVAPHPRPFGRRTQSEGNRVQQQVVAALDQVTALTTRELQLRLGVHSSEISQPLRHLVGRGVLRRDKRGHENVYCLSSTRRSVAAKLSSTSAKRR
jgi:hypothetical protein